MPNRLIIAGGNIACKTPPFLYVNKIVESEIEKHFPETKEYKKFYVVTSKSYVTGDIMKVFPAVSVGTRNDAKYYCEINGGYFSKVIRTDGYVEKFWLDDYHINRINQRSKKKRRKIIVDSKKVFQSKPVLLVEKISLRLPSWLEIPIYEKNKDFTISGKVEIISSPKEFFVMKGERLINRNFGRDESYDGSGKVYRTPKFPYQNHVALMLINKKSIDLKKWKLSQNGNIKELVKITGSRVFNYFKLIEYYRISKSDNPDEDDVVLAYTQCSDMSRAAEGVPIEMYLRLIKKHMTTPYDVSKKYAKNNWITNIKSC